MEASMESSRYFREADWMFVIGVWLVVGSIVGLHEYFSSLVIGSRVAPLPLLIITALYAAFSALLFLPARVCADHFQFTRERWFATVAILTVAGLTISAGVAELRTIAEEFFYVDEPQEMRQLGLSHAVRHHIPMGIGTFMGNVTLAYGAYYYHQLKETLLKESQLESQLAQAKLQSLRAQLQPHFLFNVLHATVALMRRNDIAGASETITTLSTMLRASLTKADVQEIPLSEELQFVRQYLRLQEILFQGDLSVSINLEAEASDVLVPNFILQPLVENAIQHGVKLRGSGGTVEISARLLETSLSLEVKDNGPGIKQGDPLRSGQGIGLANTRMRLGTIYGSASNLTLTSLDGGGTVARVIIPRRRSRLPSPVNANGVAAIGA
jgi:signal transduction histidine kinase